MLRRPAAAITAVALLLILAVPVLAGGWAEVKADAAATTEPPREGQPITLGFTVLQHGEIPAGWVTPTVTITSLAAGTDQQVTATSSGPDGHFSVTFTPDTAGYWTWVVTFPELASDPIPQTLAVADVAGVVPAFDPGMAVTAIERVRTSVRDDIYGTLDPQLQRIESQLTLQQSVNDRLTERIDGLTAERDALAAGAGVEAGVTPALLAGVVLLAVLAGAAAGFAMAWLAGRGGPRQIEVEPALSPASRGSTPA